jgi:excisionase family DNA binding protein
MLTVKEFAERFHITKMTAYRWIKKGRMRVVKIGKTIRIEQSEFDRMRRGEVNEQA